MIGEVDVTALLGRIDAAPGCSIKDSFATIDVFGPAETEDSTWRAVTAQAARLFPGLALVGYESGVDLDAPQRQGFRSVGPLRVWAR